MRNAWDSDSRCGLACDASTRDAKSLVLWVERCEPLRSQLMESVVWRFEDAKGLLDLVGPLGGSSKATATVVWLFMPHV